MRQMTGAALRVKYEGFSNDELLRRANILREQAIGETSATQHILTVLASEHEEAARQRLHP